MIATEIPNVSANFVISGTQIEKVNEHKHWQTKKYEHTYKQLE